MKQSGMFAERSRSAKPFSKSRVAIAEFEIASLRDATRTLHSVSLAMTIGHFFTWSTLNKKPNNYFGGGLGDSPPNLGFCSTDENSYHLN
ncbi:hypothetical protein BV375_29370 [Nostoc sp. 106C]|nr:hypothetical protein BV375_29370 [Nostoc sp. 106C]